MNRIQAAFLVPVIAVTLTVGCTKKGVSDDQLASTIKSSLSSDPVAKAASIAVNVKDGHVTLSGDVPSSDVELQAMKVANGTAGIRGVDDQMKVNTALANNMQPPPGNALNTAPPAASTPDVAQPPVPVPAPAEKPVRKQQPASTASEEAPAAPKETAPAAPRQVDLTVPVGQHVSVQMTDAVDSSKNTQGQTFRGTLYAPLTARGRTAIPAGADVTVTLQSAQSAGRVKGNSAVGLNVTSIAYQGKNYDVSTSTWEQTGKGRGKQTLTRTGLGAGIGAVVGAIAGGGKGAAIGSAVGGGGAAGYQVFTHGEQIKIPAETVLNFTLQAPLTVTRMRHAPQNEAQ